jgi:hypothetical protein
MDGWVASASAQQQEIIFVLGGTPTWASQCPGNTSAIIVPGSNCPPSSPTYWTDWVTAVATRYKGKIKYYELWNEPNDSGNWPTTSNAAQLMNQMAQLAHTALRAADPAALLTTPSYTGAVNAALLDKVLSYGTQPFDVVSFHSYGSYDDYASAEKFTALIQGYAAVAAKYGLSKLPFISTEGGWGTGGPYITDPAAQADFLVKYFVLHVVNGVAVATWYATDAGPEWGGLEDANGLNPAGNAYQAIHDLLVGSSIGKLSVDSDGTYSVNLVRSDGKLATIVWNSQKTVKYKVPGMNIANQVVGSVLQIVDDVVDVGTSPVYISQ